MDVRIAVALSVCLAAGLVAVIAAPAYADASTCAQTVPASPGAPTPGAACWTDVTQYPFGFDGNPVNPASPDCAAQEASVGDTIGDPIVCYLSVDSMAFRAWNRGIAVTSPPLNALVSSPFSGFSAKTPFGVWLYNGDRWFPDPTFPGQSVCPGNTAVWAGKLDYWVIGEIPSLLVNGGLQAWPALCRFDGVNFDWEPLPIPTAALAHVPRDSLGHALPGAIQTGACFAWNDCWFFGSYGVTLHWDGQSLTDATPDTANSPWLESDLTAAVAGTDAAGNPFAFAVTAAPRDQKGEPDGTPSPQLWRSSGRAFTPLGLPSNVPPAGTDLVAAAVNAGGQGWLAGDPGGELVTSQGTLAPYFSNPFTATAITPEPSPLIPLSASGAVPCTPVDSFRYSGNAGYLWSSISVFPTGGALAGGVADTDGAQEPVLAEVSCNQSPSSLQLVDAGRDSVITAVAANAVNRGWAATASSTTPNGNTVLFAPLPGLYHLTDNAPPLAPAGDDVESRPIVTQSEPTIFEFVPPVVVPPPAPSPTPAPKPGKTTITHVKARPPIYAVQPPKLARISTGRFSLSIRFKVRSKVTIGIEALRRGKVVSKSGFKTFRGKTGELVLALDVNQWPTSLKFIFPKKQGHK